jgi:hypothetical protein
MSDRDPPLSEQALPSVDRGPLSAYPLGPELTVQLRHMSATILAGLAPAGEQPAGAVALAVALVNELQLYRLVDNRIVKL